MKIYYIMIAPTFLKGHPKAGEFTDFKRKIQAGTKIHTIRQNFLHWQPRVLEINAGDAKLELRQWSGKPYNSPQLTIATLYSVGIQRVSTDGRGHFKVDDQEVDPEVLAKNDGLSIMDMLDWFQVPMPNGALIHFHKFRYGA